MFGIGTYGGNIIDADRQRLDGEERDNFEELVPQINVENTANYTSVVVLNDGTERQPAVVRATGPDDLLDFVNPSSVVDTASASRFPPAADDRDLPVEVQTDYILEPGADAVRIETTITNPAARPLDIFLGDYLNGSGQVELFQPGYGFGEPLVTTPCPAATFVALRAGMCDLCNFVAYAGEDEAAGVSYGYVHAVNGSSTFTVSGVTVPLLGNQVLLVLIGARDAELPPRRRRQRRRRDHPHALVRRRRRQRRRRSRRARTRSSASRRGTLDGHGHERRRSRSPTPTSPSSRPPSAGRRVDERRRPLPHRRRRHATAARSPPGTLHRAREQGRPARSARPIPRPSRSRRARPSRRTSRCRRRARSTSRVTDESGAPIPPRSSSSASTRAPIRSRTQTILGLINNATGVFGERVRGRPALRHRRRVASPTRTATRASSRSSRAPTSSSSRAARATRSSPQT